MKSQKAILILFVLFFAITLAGEGTFFPREVRAQATPLVTAALDLSPDGTRIALGGAGNILQIWDAATLTLLSSIEVGKSEWSEAVHPNIQSVDWNPDNIRLAVSVSTGNPLLGFVQIVNTQTGQILATLPGENFVSSVMWSLDGSMLAAGGRRDTGIRPEGWIKVWNTNDFTLMGDLTQGDADQVTQVSWSPDGSRLASSAFDDTLLDNNVWVWNTSQWQPQFKLEHSGPVASVTWSPDGSRIVTGGAGVPGRVWDAATGQLLIELQLPEDLPKALKRAGFVLWRPNTNQVVSITLHDYKYWFLAWDAITGELTDIQPTSAWCIQFAFSSDGNWLIYEGEDKVNRVSFLAHYSLPFFDDLELGSANWDAEPDWNLSAAGDEHYFEASPGSGSLIKNLDLVSSLDLPEFSYAALIFDTAYTLCISSDPMRHVSRGFVKRFL